MKNRLVILVIILLLAISLNSAVRENIETLTPWACTSFAVYSESPLYGMNFDYPDVPIQFTIREFGDLSVFQMEFNPEGGYIPTAGMNSAGLFASSQMLFPEMPETFPGDGTPMTIWQLYQAVLYHRESVADVLALVDEFQITNSGLTLHDLFADPGGEAVVVEVIEDQEELTAISGKSIVMTNFPVSSIRGQPIEEIEGVGADRYQIATLGIQDNLDEFQVDDGLRILEETALEGEFSTQASMLFDPINLEVYIALDRDFNKIWLVSLKENTISTFRGFKGRETLPVDHNGVKEEVMIDMGLSSTGIQIQVKDLLLPVALLSIIILFIWFRRRSAGQRSNRNG